MFTCPVLILLCAWLTFNFPMWVLWFLFTFVHWSYCFMNSIFSSSDHRYLWTVPYGASDCPPHPLFFNIDFFFMYTTFCNFLCITVLESERIQNRPPPWLTIGLGNRLSGVYVTSENDQLAYENTNIRFMMNLLFTHYIYMYIEITTLIDT
jgi:hypothetical protein